MLYFKFFFGLCMMHCGTEGKAADPCCPFLVDIIHQALAAVGQCRLMSLWDNLFGHLRQPVAQILLTRNDIADVC